MFDKTFQTLSKTLSNAEGGRQYISTAENQSLFQMRLVNVFLTLPYNADLAAYLRLIPGEPATETLTNTWKHFRYQQAELQRLCHPFLD